MQDFTQLRTSAGTQAASFDTGLRQYMLKVYNYMASGLLLTGILAWFTSQSPALFSLFFSATGPTPLGWVVMFAPVGIVLFLSFRQHRMSPAAAQGWFWAYAALTGISFATLFMVYTGESITRAFLVTASVFGAMSIYGYTTKRDLTGWGSFLFMGVIGMLIAGVVNIWLQSPAIHFVTSAVGVLLGVGLTAYDTQKIKEIYFQVGSAEEGQKMAVMGALSLYIDFIYLFIHLMRFFGQSRD